MIIGTIVTPKSGEEMEEFYNYQDEEWEERRKEDD